MKRCLLIVVTTVLVFLAGFESGVWTERSRPLPPPPGTFLGEFGGKGPPGGGAPSHQPPINRGELIAQIASLGPQIDAYKSQLAQINSGFDSGFKALLNPDQLAKYDTRSKRHSDMNKEREYHYLSDEEINRYTRQQPAMQAFRIVVLTWELSILTKELKLDPSQQAQTLALLRDRREKFIALVDSTPPPSIMLSRLASQVKNLVAPKP
jgi:hypothetical protein